jgi:hypothetical protein
MKGFVAFQVSLICSLAKPHAGELLQVIHGSSYALVLIII